ncbi:MAG: coproporphyrinogen III oxidase [Candidatus Marinimicrobia bacterium]|nr:coproporphyrinogen III oxidase [Candidatus Neomarinimicrobiota bacterium]|tara:strand:+ start:18315 stop:19442 length:1128 start_codon:yes stop_codon:yes gene_type:complete
MKKAGLYIHIPFCKVKCVYCDFYSITKKEDQIPLFTECLLKEIDNYKHYAGKWEFNTIFFGGGTPSLLPAKYLEKILQKLHNTFDTSKVKEITLEANPGEAPLEHLKDIKNLGVNRLSMGFQSFDDKILKILGRLHKSDDCFKTFKNARKAGFDNISTDMIFNIPKLSTDNWKKDLNKLLDLGPNHISAYSLTVEPSTKLFHLVKRKEVLMPLESTDIEQFLLTEDILLKHGFYHYEISNYAKKGMESKHNLHYWNLSPYLSFGPSAHSYDLKKRWWNVKSLEKYINLLSKNKSPVDNKELLSRHDNFNEIILNGLRLKRGIKLSDLNNYNDLISKDSLNKINNKWDCLSISNKNIKLIDNGFLFVDEITKDLFI